MYDSVVHDVRSVTAYFRCDIRDTGIQDKKLSTTRFIDCRIRELDREATPDVIAFRQEVDRLSYSQKCVYEWAYKVGKKYRSEIFSTSERGCHPGLHVTPIRMNTNDIVVAFRPEDLHSTGNMHRVREFEVIA